MHFSRALVALAAAGLASAQLPNVPSCSLSCFASALTSDGCSSLTDFACHCQKPQLISTVTPCVKDACSVADQSSVSNIVVSQCSSAGHPISIPPVGAATTSASSAESSASTTGSSSESSSASGSSSATKTPTGSASASPTASSSPAGSSSPTGSASATASESASSTGSQSASASSPLFTGAASNVKGNMAGVVALAAAAAYML